MKTEDIKTWQHRPPPKQSDEPALWREESKARQEEIDELRAVLKERDAKLTALEGQESVAGTIKIGDKILAAPSGSCSTTHFVTINVISNSRAVAPVVNQHTRLHYLKGSDAIATFCALSDLFSGACQETSRVNKPNLYAAAGAAPVPEGWQLVPVEPTDAMLASARDWSYAKYGKPIGNAAAVGCWEAMLAAALKERS